MEADPAHSVLIVESLHQAVNVLMIAWPVRNRSADTLLRFVRAPARAFRTSDANRRDICLMISSGVMQLGGIIRTSPCHYS